MEQVKNALAAEQLLRKVYQHEPIPVGVDAYLIGIGTPLEIS
jgi:hypothetical protein